MRQEEFSTSEVHDAMSAGRNDDSRRHAFFFRCCRKRVHDSGSRRSERFGSNPRATSRRNRAMRRCFRGSVCEGLPRFSLVLVVASLEQAEEPERKPFSGRAAPRPETGAFSQAESIDSLFPSRRCPQWKQARRLAFRIAVTAANSVVSVYGSILSVESGVMSLCGPNRETIVLGTHILHY